jgi:hypothetical protein
MMATTLIAPSVEFFSGKQEAYVGVPGLSWRRITPKEAAQDHTGFAHATRECHVGVYVVPVSNGLVRLGFDLWRLDMNLKPSVCERLEQCLRSRVTGLSKSQLRYFYRHSHVSRSHADFVVRPEDLSGLKDELSAILSDLGSYEAI